MVVCGLTNRVRRVAAQTCVVPLPPPLLLLVMEVEMDNYRDVISKLLLYLAYVGVGLLFEALYLLIVSVR